VFHHGKVLVLAALLQEAVFAAEISCLGSLPSAVIIHCVSYTT
jgi:hypothetical protein